MSPEDQAEEQPVAQYKKLLACNSFLFVVFYRGHWCPFCMAYLNTLQALTSSIEGACGKVVAITAEPSEHITATRAASGYTGTLIVDEDNQLVKEMKSTAATDVAITERKGYAKGMAQPAVIVIKNSGEVVHSWAIVPSLMNLGGAKDRPDLNQVWDNVKAKMDGREQVHQKYMTQSITAGLKQALFGKAQK